MLIEGESGVGKELIARAIHGTGERRAGRSSPSIAARIPDNLVESILFGHEKGAFTGATERHTGKFVEATRRHAVPRRGRRTAAGGAGQAVARHPGRRGRAGRRAQAGQGRRPPDLGDQPQPDRRREGRPFPRRSVLPAARVSDLACRRCANGAEDIPDLARHFLARFAAEEGKRIAADQRRGAGAAHLPTAGPAMSASSKTPMFRAVVLAEGDELGAAEFPQIAAQAARTPAIAGDRADRLAAAGRSRTDASPHAPIASASTESGIAPQRLELGAGTLACSTRTAMSAPWTRSKPTSSALPSPITAGRCRRSRGGCRSAARPSTASSTSSA